MFKKLLLTLSVSIAFCCGNGAFPTPVIAQCGCQNSSCDGGCSGSHLDGSNFMANVGTGASQVFPTCDDGSCPVPACCPSRPCGPYVSFFGGLTTIDSFGVDGITLLPPPNLVENRGFNGDDGFGTGFAIGRQVHPQMRFEVEGTYRENDIEAYQVFQYDIPSGILTNQTEDTVFGDVKSYSILANLVYDFTPRCVGMTNFYAGAGIGGIGVNGNAITATNVFDINDETFAYQIIAGINRSVSKRLDVFVDYRFVDAASIDVFDQNAGLVQRDFDFTTNNLFFGMRLRR